MENLKYHPKNLLKKKRETLNLSIKDLAQRLGYSGKKLSKGMNKIARAEEGFWTAQFSEKLISSLNLSDAEIAHWESMFENILEPNRYFLRLYY